MGGGITAGLDNLLQYCIDCGGKRKAAGSFYQTSLKELSMKIERLLTTTVMLLNRRKVTAGELAGYFGISLRTVYRDIETLNASGIPVISSQGYDGGFSIPDNYRLSRQLLTFEDMLAILTTLKGVNYTLQNRDLDRVIEKIAALVPAEKEEAYQRHNDSFLIDIGPWGGSKGQEGLIGEIQRAIGGSRLLQFDYCGAGGEASRRLVEPHALVQKSFTWYLLGFCRLRGDFRVFRLSRMDGVSVADGHFLRRQVEPRQFFLPENDSRPLVTVSLRFSGRVRVRVEEGFGREQLSAAAEDGSLIATFSLPENEWIMAMILSYGDDVEVLAPPRLRAAVAEKIEGMRKKYRNLT